MKHRERRVEIYGDPRTRNYHMGLAYLVERVVGDNGRPVKATPSGDYLQLWKVCLVEPNEELNSLLGKAIEAGGYTNIDPKLTVGKKLTIWINNSDMPDELKESDNQTDAFIG